MEQFKVRMGHCIEPASDPHPELEPTVQYHTDEDTLREDVKTLAGWQEPEMTEEHIEAAMKRYSDPNV